ncbi:hypothetical protein ACH42_14790 [Endozoicomonas sp. (ex Bugula neritina AB1)]|nr:hypothetical protein ACH42_14790 [Endozoicomonas sp. (ex Bugula neritina AB1)]
MLTRHAKLIVPLCTLLEKRNLTDTADALSLSKSAVSKILKKAREIFNDSLLERQGNDMLITPMGKELLPKLQLLRSAAAECFPGQLSDKKHQGVFTLLMFCDWVHAIGTSLIDQLHAAFPDTKFTVSNLSDDFQERLAKGDADIAVYLHSDFQFPFTSTVLTTSQPGLFIPRALQVGGDGISFNDFETYPLVIPDVPMRREKHKAILTLLNSESIKRGVALRSDNLSVLQDYALKNNALLIATPMLSLLPLVNERFRLVKAPSPLSELFNLIEFSVIRHERSDHLSMHKEVEKIVIQVVAEFSEVLPNVFLKKASLPNLTFQEN